MVDGFYSYLILMVRQKISDLGKKFQKDHREDKGLQDSTKDKTKPWLTCLVLATVLL